MNWWIINSRIDELMNYLGWIDELMNSRIDELMNYLVGPSRDHDMRSLKKEKPGIDREVVAVQHIQILDLCYFLKLSNKCHEIWSSDHFRGDPRKCSCFSKICTVQATLGVKNKWFFIRVPRGLFGFNISLPYVGTSSEWRWGSSGSRMVLRRCGVANDLTWFEISRKWAAPERCMYIGKSIESTKKCVCTNVLWFLWKTRNVCIIMFQSFLKNIRKFQEHFSHDNSYHRNRCVLNYSQKSRHPSDRLWFLFDLPRDVCT